MSTRIYGTSDDLIEVEGDIYDEFGAWGGTHVKCSDGTILKFEYSPDHCDGIWKASIIRTGTLFDRIDVCNDPDSIPYSDQVWLKDGITSVLSSDDVSMLTSSNDDFIKWLEEWDDDTVDVVIKEAINRFKELSGK